jgi:L-aminopeptidase/D-esterase-like protein
MDGRPDIQAKNMIVLFTDFPRFVIALGLAAANATLADAQLRARLNHCPSDGEVAALIDLQAAEDRDVKMAAADEAERHCAVERAGAGQRCHRTAAGVGQGRMSHAFFRRRSGADQAVLGLEEHMRVLGR